MQKIFIIGIAALLTFSISCRKKKGCTNPCAKNYNNAKEDDGSCQYEKPTAEYSYRVKGCTRPYVVSFMGDASNLYCGLNYEWDFGDYTTSHERNPDHLFTYYGSYNIILKITNGDQQSIDQFTLKLDSNPQPISLFSYDFQNNNDRLPAKVNFSNWSSFTSDYNWDFGDGYSSYLENPTHYYNGAGIYTVKLTCTCGGKSTTSIQKISIRPAPTVVNITRIKLPGGSTELSSEKGTPLYAEFLYDNKSYFVSKIYNWKTYPVTLTFPSDLSVGTNSVYDNFSNNDYFTFKIWIDEFGLNDRVVYSGSMDWQYLSNNFYPTSVYWQSGSDEMEVLLDYQ
jgi:PKD repeat protein